MVHYSIVNGKEANPNKSEKKEGTKKEPIKK